MFFKIADGRDKLYQWDTGVKLLIDESIGQIDEVHFVARFSKDLYSVNVVKNDTERYVIIPSVLLEQRYYIFVYAYCYNENGSITKLHSTIEVISRPKPADYVYTDEEKESFKNLDDRVSNLENGVTIDIDQTYDPLSEKAQSGKAVAEAVAKVSGGGGNVDLSDYYTKTEIDTMIGDIDTALDNIIAIQNELIGGESV